ncbi:hypothetical protein D9758_014347 [Tetrapyrgos nigripes]|uniref:Uncharacterized protein n=1 Tax=Tetrapyrgos nigripes TaxID=182062 RepID=A0A8H5FH46_9AGAR|nr:hypothetical protein D9758_014347 [Tetrapyrgos nigripes]
MPSKWTRHATLAHSSTILSAFELIASRENLGPGTRQYWDRRSQYVSSEIRRIFSAIFGVDVDSLEGWKKLCTYVLGTTGVRLEELKTIKDCKKKLKDKFVNLIDLVEFAERGEPLPTTLVFHSRKGLSKYTRNTKQFFPKEDAKELPLLRHFLITIFA